MPSISRRAKVLIGIAVVLLAILLIGPRVVDLYTSFLWFSSLGHTGVLETTLVTRVLLFVAVGVVMGLFTFAGLWLAHRVRPAFLPSATDDPVVRYRAVVISRLKTFAIVPSVLVGLISGIFGQSAWEMVLLFVNREPFGVADPEFGKDIGFYAFELPFIQFVLGLVFAGLILMFLTNVIAHYVFGGIRLAGRDGSLSRGARIQLAAIAGVFLLAKATGYWFDRYALLYSTRSGMFTGAGYTDIHAVLPAKIILTGIAVICAAAFFAGVVMRDLRIPAVATVLMLFSSVIVGFGWPQVVQTFTVNPSTEREIPYIERNLAATKIAYGLDDSKVVRAGEKESDLDLQTLTEVDTASLQNVRLLDPNVVSGAFSKLNELREYYKLPDELALDRYRVDNELTNVLLAPIELDPANTSDDWATRHMQFTHGNGILTAPAGRVDRVIADANKETVDNTGNAGGQPVFTKNGVGGQKTVTQPRIYFGEIIGADKDFYSIVGGGTETREFDGNENGQDQRSRYQGQGGVEIGNWFTKLAYAVKFGERNILLNPNIVDGSKIIYQRDPRDRVKQLAPFLTIDTKTYPVIDSKTGHILWVVDGYTTLPKYPYSEQTSLKNATQASPTAPADARTPNARRQPDEKVGYIRNSVKATVDAYDGTVHLYDVDEKDPVLKAWKKVFPGLVEDRDQVPPEIAAHFRYPQDLFEVQRYLLQKYHVTDANTYRQGNDVWQLAKAPKDTPDKNGNQAPYYSVASNLQTGDPYFQLSSLLQPRDQQYLAAQVTVSSAPETYGQITVRRPPRRMPGPEQAADLIKGSQPYTSDNANIRAIEPQFGNLQSIALANGGMAYVWPMYARSTSEAPQKLIKVLALNPITSGAGYQPTVAEALKQAGFRDVDAVLDRAAEGVSGGSGAQDNAGAAPEEKAATVPGAGSGAEAEESPELQTAVKNVSTAWSAVLDAQKSGDQVAVGQAMQKLGDAVSKLSAAEAKEQGQQPGK